MTEYCTGMRSSDWLWSASSIQQHTGVDQSAEARQSPGLGEALCLARKLFMADTLIMEIPTPGNTDAHK